MPFIMQQPSPQPTDQDVYATRFSDDNDAHLFESCGELQLAGEILGIKHNDPTVKDLWLEDEDDLNGAAWRRLGDMIGQNTHLEELSLVDCRVDVEDMCVGLQSNRSIRNLWLARIDLQNTEKMSSLAPFLTHNPCLKNISLRNCRLGHASINILANALSSGTESNLEELNLGGNPIGDVLDDLIEVFSESRRLRKLYFSSCKIGPRVCAPLVTLLENPESNLTGLDLLGNYINNESTITFAGSLVNNKKLRILDLTGNNGITAEGWSAMLQLVFNSSSVNNLISSNHVLHSIGYNHSLKKRCIQAMGVDDGNLLPASLKLNEGDDELLIARRKIIWGHAREDINLGEASIDMGAMPRILSWIGNDSNEFDAKLIQYHEPPLREPEIGTIRLGGIYRILRSMPDLCNCKRDENATLANDITWEPQVLRGAKRKRDHV